jgi:hypothetical protein
MAWPKPGPGRPRTLKPEERLRADTQKNAYQYLRSVPDGFAPGIREIAVHMFKVTVHDEMVEWAARKIGIDDLGRVRAMLAGVLLKDFQLQTAERAIEGLERVGLIAKVGDGWEQHERIERRQAERREQQRQEEEAGDILVAREWLSENWGALTFRGDPEPHEFQPFRREMRSSLIYKLEHGGYSRGFDAHSIQRGLRLLGGSDDAVLVSDVGNELLTDAERAVRQRQRGLEFLRPSEPQSNVQPEQVQSEQVAEPQPQQSSHAQPDQAIKTNDAATMDQPETPQQVETERRRRRQKEEAWLRELELEQAEYYPPIIAKRRDEADRLEAEAANFEAEVETRRAAGRGTVRAEKKAKDARVAAEDARADADDTVAEAAARRIVLYKQRAIVRGFEAAAEARGAGKTDAEARSMGQAAYEVALKEANA